jgi:hypothetical protein
MGKYCVEWRRKGVAFMQYKEERLTGFSDVPRNFFGVGGFNKFS